MIYRCKIRKKIKEKQEEFEIMHYFSFPSRNFEDNIHENGVFPIHV